jgi:hypothetical protein
MIQSKMYSRKKVTEAAFRTMINTLNKDMIGTGGELKLQKRIYAVTCCNKSFQIGWVYYCRPGSNKHLKSLKDRKYSVNSMAQVCQILKVISEKANMPAPKAEHVIWTCLSNKDSNIEGSYNLNLSMMGIYGNVYVPCLDATDRMEEINTSGGGAAKGDIAQYYPDRSRQYTC